MSVSNPIRFTVLTTAIVFCAVAASVATASDFLKIQTSRIDLRLASLNAAVEHQEIIVAGLKTMLKEGHAAPQEVAIAGNALDSLKGEREFVQRMSDNLRTIRTSDEMLKADTLVLPIPALKGLHSTEAISHVSFRLNSEGDKQLADNIQALMVELRQHQATALYEAIGERHDRLTRITQKQPSAARELQLLSLRQAAYKSTTLADTSSVPILSNSTQEYRIGDKTVRGEDGLIRLVANNTNRLRYAVALNQRQHEAMLWEQKVSVLQQVEHSDRFHRQELRYARSGHEFYTSLSAALESQSGEYDIILTSDHSSSSSLAAVLSELHEIAEQHASRRQQATKKCMALTGLEEKLARLATRDPFFAGELATVRRALAVAQTQAAVYDQTDAVHHAATAFVESLPQRNRTVRVPAKVLSTTQALQTVFELAADYDANRKAIQAQMTVAQSQATGLRALHEEGYASWWEAREAEAHLEDLKTKAQRQELIHRINTLCLELIENGEPILAEEEVVVLTE